MKRLIIAVALALPFAVYAAPPSSSAFKDCSMKMSAKDKVSKKTELLAKAKIKEDEAKKIALSTGESGATLAKGGIEMEDGCLVYSYHVRAADKKTQTEVFVDAGNGNILKTEKEGKLRTALEKPVDKTKELAAKGKEKVTGEASTSQAKKP
jgi:ribosome-associated translation inhibitor RaiA